MTQAPASRVRWLLIGWLFVLSAVAFLDRVNLSIAGGALSAEYHLTNVQFGFLSTALLIGYTLFQTPAGWLADRFGPSRVLTSSVLWWGVFTALTAAIPVSLVSPFAALIGVRFLLGAGEAIMYPASNAVCVALDSVARTWRCQWLDIRRSRRRLRTLALHRHLHDEEPRLAIFVLGLRVDRLCRRNRLVSLSARQTGATSARFTV